MPLKFWDEAFIAATYLINRTQAKLLISKHLLAVFTTSSPTTPFFELLGAHVGLIYAPTTQESLLLDPKSESSIKASSALMLEPVESTSLGMWYLMRIFFPLPNSTLTPVHFSSMKFFSYQSI
jgi:hypothetical protein